MVVRWNRRRTRLLLIFYFEIDHRITKRFEDLSDIESQSKSGRPTYGKLPSKRSLFYF